MSPAYFLKLSFFKALIRLFQWVVPKDYNIWLIGMDDGGGVRLSANAWYFLNYLAQNEPQLRVICITSHRSVEEELKKISAVIVRPNTIKAFWLALRAGVYFICGELHDEIPNFSKTNTFKIHLWHGVPLKRIFYGSKKVMDRYQARSMKMKVLDLMRGRVQLEEYDAIIYTSEGFKKIMIEAFHNPNVFLTGQPRDDAFYNPPTRDQLLKGLGLEHLKEYKIVCYLPTFRDSLNKKLNYKVFLNNEEALQVLEQERIVLIQKDHNSILEESEQYGNVLHLTNDVETQMLLLLADVLVTDYSSVYIDYLHLKRPSVFYCYDLEKYTSQDRELYFNYFDELITPGLKVKDEASLLQAILVSIEQPHQFRELRQKSLDFFHFYQDGRNSHRVAEMTKKLIERKKS